MKENEFIKSIMYLKSYYNNFDFDLKDELKVKIWHNEFKTFDDLSMQNIVKLYTSVSKYPPNSPYDLIEPLNKMYRDKQLDEDEARTKFREIETIKGGLYYCRKKVYEELEKYPLIYKVLKDMEYKLNGRLENDTFLIKDFKKYYNELKNKHINHDTQLSIVNNEILETKKRKYNIVGRFENMIINKNCLDGLKGLENESIDCIITSPPYYQLRKYGDNNKELGQENSPVEFINNLTIIFEECKRVLKKDGTMFIIIGDTYNGNKKGKTDLKVNEHVKNSQNDLYKKIITTIENKSLIGIPARLKISLIDSGWICRNDIIWHKPNCMPSSVKDRFTIDYENILFFTKSQKYYFNQLKEPMKTTDISSPRGSKGCETLNSGLRKQDNVGRADYTGFNDRYHPPTDLMRNMRSVWQISTEVNKVEHYATFPKEIVFRCLECGCKKGGTVLDIFAGSGTTLSVAKENGYNYIGIELYEKYCKIIEKRLKETIYQIKMEDLK